MEFKVGDVVVCLKDTTHFIGDVRGKIGKIVDIDYDICSNFLYKVEFNNYTNLNISDPYIGCIIDYFYCYDIISLNKKKLKKLLNYT